MLHYLLGSSLRDQNLTNATLGNSSVNLLSRKFIENNLEKQVIKQTFCTFDSTIIRFIIRVISLATDKMAPVLATERTTNIKYNFLISTLSLVKNKISKFKLLH